MLERLKGSVVYSELKHFLEDLWIKYIAFRFQLLCIIGKILTREFSANTVMAFLLLTSKIDRYQTKY